MEEGEYWTKVSLCYSIVYYYNGAQRYEQFYRSVNCIGLSALILLLGLALRLLSTSVSLVFMVLYIYILTFFFLHLLLYLLVSWAWWDRPLTNHHSSVLWHCWLGHLTHNIVSEMTYNVSSGTLNPTIPFHSGRNTYGMLTLPSRILRLDRTYRAHQFIFSAFLLFFCFVLCGRLSWLSVIFITTLKIYRIVLYIIYCIVLLNCKFLDWIVHI